MQETRELFQETERIMRLNSEETDRKMQETERIMRLNSEETDRKMQETDRKMQETDRKIKEVSVLVGRLGNRLGEFVESMVRPAVVKLFQDRGLDVHKVQERALFKEGKEEMEVDLLVTNCGEMVAVECKSRLTEGDVEDHVKRMEKFKLLAPEYRDLKVCGAVAGMVVDRDAAAAAAAAGLFLLVQNGENVEVATVPGFVAREF